MPEPPDPEITRPRMTCHIDRATPLDIWKYVVSSNSRIRIPYRKPYIKALSWNSDAITGCVAMTSEPSALAVKTPIKYDEQPSHTHNRSQWLTDK
ncbi:hypothetical protein AAE478_001027 [Parahypoxylon ruwenzoriense]